MGFADRREYLHPLQISITHLFVSKMRR
jgi:hypothetical protein